MSKYVIDGDSDDIEHIIEQKIHNARYRRVLKLRFLEGMTYEKIAEDKKVDRSPRQVANIIRNCVPKLVRKSS